MPKPIISIAVTAACLALVVGCTTPSTPKPAEKPTPEATTRPSSGTSGTAEGFPSGRQDAAVAALAAQVENKLGQPVTLSVATFTEQADWVFAEGKPMTPQGAPIDYSKTSYRTAVEQGAFDDGFSALMRLENGAWRVVALSIGATDVPWVEWPSTYGAPKDIFPAL